MSLIMLSLTVMLGACEALHADQSVLPRIVSRELCLLFLWLLVLLLVVVVLVLTIVEQSAILRAWTDGYQVHLEI